MRWPWGGEEFVIVVNSVDTAGLTKFAEKIRVLIQASSLDFNNEHLNVTASIGGTLATKNDNVANIITRADSLMYESKKAGRNCVTIA